MSEEDKKAAEAAAAVEAAEKREKELVEITAKAEEAVANMTEELKGERTKKQDALKELEELKGKQDPKPTGDDPEEVVERVLTRRQEEESKSNFASSIDDFKKTVPAFSKESDEAGIAFGKFENELKKFNFDGLNSKEEFMTRFKEVQEYMNRGKKETDEPESFHQGTPQGDGSDPGEDDSATLNDAEKRFIREDGMDKAKFLEIKAKRPHYVASLLKLRG